MRRHRGIVLASVAVIGAASIWLAAAMVQVAAVTVSASDLDMSRAGRLLRLESALRVLSAQLAEQRSELAQGLPADLPEETTLWTRHGRRVVARLMAEGDAVPEPIAEAGRLDANHASVDALARLEGLDADLAESIVAARDAARNGRLADHAAVLASIPEADRSVALTVYAHEPVHRPEQVIVQPWSDDLRGELSGLLEEQAIDVLESLPEGDPETFAPRVAAASSDPALWGEILLHTAPAPSGYIAGRIDLASAPAHVLATLEGIDGEKALHLVAVRDTLPMSDRARLSWPWTDAGLDRALEATLLERLTVGSFTWRCTLACGEVLEDDEHDVLHDAAFYEVVFDVSDDTPRIAMLRERLAAPGALDQLPLPQLREKEEVPSDVSTADVEPELTLEPLDWPDPEPHDALDEEAPLDTEEAVSPDSEPSSSDDPRVGRWR